MVFLGNGAASVFAVLELLDNGYTGEIIMIDKGENPYLRSKKELLNGFLGAGLYSDAKFIFSPHRDQPVFNFTDDILPYYAKIQNFIEKFHPNFPTVYVTFPEDIKTNTYREGWNSVAIKQSLCWHVGSVYGIEIGKRWYDYMVQKGVKFLFNTEVKSINPVTKEVELSTGIIKYNNLFIGFGKTGAKWLENFYSENNIKQENTEAHIGVRFETEFNKAIEDIVKFQYDFKFAKQVSETKSIRTFCVCHKSAYVAEETFQMPGTLRKQFNGEGYGMDNSEKYNGLTNFGIICCINKKKANEIVQKITSNLNYKGYAVDAGSTFKPSLETEVITEGKFLEYYEEIGHDIIDFIEELKPVLGFGNNYRFYLPEIKEVSNSVDLKNDLSLPRVENIHVIGDSMGTRGIVPAGVSGMIAIQKFLKGNK